MIQKKYGRGRRELISNGIEYFLKDSNFPIGKKRGGERAAGKEEGNGKLKES